MNTYDELYGALLKLCQNEGLELVETKLRNPKAIYFRLEDRIVLNVKRKEEHKK